MGKLQTRFAIIHVKPAGLQIINHGFKREEDSYLPPLEYLNITIQG